MTRLLFLLLVTADLLTVASIPVANGRPMRCMDRVEIQSLCGGDCTVNDILKLTGLSFNDFILLQNGNLMRMDTNGVRPATIITATDVYDRPTDVCISGYFS